MHQDYYEGILQLRNVNSNIVDFIHRLIDKREGVSIAKVIKLKNGFDIYLSSQRYIQALGKRLVEAFGGELKISKRLHTLSRVSGKRIYRVTVLFRQPSFKKGDTILFRGENLLILSLGKKVFCRNMKTGKKRLMPYNKLNIKYGLN